MNTKQKIYLWVGITVIAIMGIFPPTPHGYYYEAHYGGFGPNKEEQMKPLGHSFHSGYTSLFTAKASEIALGKLIVQWSVVAVVTGGSIYSFKGKKDNKKQKICLWIGIAVIVLMAIFPPVDKRIISVYSRTNRGLVPDYKTIKYAFFFTAKSQEIEYRILFGQWCIIGAATIGLIYTFRDRKPKGQQTELKYPEE